MKKTLAMLLALTLAAAVCAFAAADEADFLGTWYLNGINMEGNEINPASMGMEMILEVSADGTYVLSTPGAEEADQPGTWKLDMDDGVEELELAVEGVDDDFSLKIVNGELVGEEDGLGMRFGREKEEAEVYTPAEPAADAKEEDYAGKWTAVKVDMDGLYADYALFGGVMGDFTAEIEGTTITLTGLIMYDNTAVQAAFADGKLECVDELGNTITAQLLQDGSLKLVTAAAEGDGMTLILEKVQ